MGISSQRPDQRDKGGCDQSGNDIKRNPDPEVIREAVSPRSINHHIGLIANRRRKSDRRRKHHGHRKRARVKAKRKRKLDRNRRVDHRDRIV